MSEITEEELKQIATNFLLNSPPGEFMEVVTGLLLLLFCCCLLLLVVFFVVFWLLLFVVFCLLFFVGWLSD
jgi:hypothetical protein